MKRGLALVVVMLAWTAPTAMANTPSSDEVVQWNRTLLGIVSTPGAQPGTVHPTRSMAMMHGAIHDAVVAIDRSAPRSRRPGSRTGPRSGRSCCAGATSSAPRRRPC